MKNQTQKAPERLDEWVDEYIALIRSAPNDKGVHEHPVYKTSKLMLLHMSILFGEAKVRHALEDRFNPLNQG